MSNSNLLKAGALILLITAVLITPASHRNWLVYALLPFGIANVLLEVPGTRTIRIVSVVMTCLVLFSQDPQITLWGSLLAWLMWPPAFVAAWALTRRPTVPATATETPGGKFARISLTAIISGVAMASIAYRLIVVGDLQQTAALFVGIPALLAIVVVLTVSPRSATGVACKAVTVGLLVSLLFLGEGMLCVVISAPLFYLVAIVVAQAVQFIHSRRTKQTTMFSSLILLILLPMSFEGVTPSTTVARNETVVETKIVHASSADVERALFQTPRFDRKTSWFLRVGFPRPIQTEMENTRDEMQWRIRFRGGEMRVTGMEPRTGDLVLVLDEAHRDYVRWRAISDDSHMMHFLRWREAVVEWTPIDSNTTRITWTINYERRLDPAWYFGPMERYAVGLAADYLIDSVATP